MWMHKFWKSKLKCVILKSKPLPEGLGKQGDGDDGNNQHADGDTQQEKCAWKVVYKQSNKNEIFNLGVMITTQQFKVNSLLSAGVSPVITFDQSLQSPEYLIPSGLALILAL